MLTKTYRGIRPTIAYWLGLDSHVYSMAISSNVLFGFFPFMLLVLSVSQNYLGWSGAERAIYVGLRGFLPHDPGLVEFVERNLRAALATRGSQVEVVSIVLLVLASNGIFMPLEVALNRLWGFTENRPYWKNQLISFSFTFTSGLLTLSAALWASSHVEFFEGLLAGRVQMPDAAVLIALKLAEVPFVAIIFLLVYWVLPNGPVPFKRAAVTAVVVAILVELGQLAYSWAWPMLDLRREYGPFFISVTLLLWGFFAAMIVLAAGEVYSRPARATLSPPSPPAPPEPGFMLAPQDVVEAHLGES